MHLSPDALVDLAEGTRPEGAEAHLRQCEMCRRQVADLRAAITSALRVDVPEPSPLFWDHFSDRVRRAVAVEGGPSRSPGPRVRAWPSWAVAGGLAVALIVLVTTGRGTRSVPSAVPVQSGAGFTADDPGADAGALSDSAAADDASLALMANLASQMDPESVVEAGLVNHVGSLDEVVVTLTPGERGELQRLLKAELAKS